MHRCVDYRGGATARRILLAVALAGAFGLASTRSTAVEAADTTPAGVAHETVDWRVHGLDYSQQRFSPLRQIDTRNVGHLVPRWIYQTGSVATFQATPIVVDGVLYLSMPFNHVAAIDARSGRVLWRYEHKRVTNTLCCGPANRGVAVADGKVFLGTVDARLIALDQHSGRLLWDQPLSEPTQPLESADRLAQDDPLRQRPVSGTTGVSAVMAPLVYNGKVIIGIAGVGYGLHLDSERPGAPVGAVIGFAGQSHRAGFYAAFDANTGKRLWQFNTVPEHGWEGEFRTHTPDGAPLDRDIAQERATLAAYPDAAARGGGSAWTTPALDAERGLIYVGTGNPSPQMDDVSRPGDNLYTVSLVALDVETGTPRWHYQQVPHDLWGFDVASPPVLLDVEWENEQVPAVAQAGKTGWLYVLDRRDGRLLFKSEPFVPQINLFARPNAQGVIMAPAAAGGANWSPMAVDAAAGLAYVAAMHQPARYTVRELPASGDKPAVRYTVLDLAAGERWGTLSAIDLRARGRIRWQVKTPHPLIGGVLATAGGLVFTGEGDGRFSAFDGQTGARLWQFNCGAGVNAPAITYSLDGTQYIAVAAGGNQLFGFAQGGALIVFALAQAER